MWYFLTCDQHQKVQSIFGSESILRPSPKCFNSFVLACARLCFEDVTDLKTCNLECIASSMAFRPAPITGNHQQLLTPMKETLYRDTVDISLPRDSNFAHFGLCFATCAHLAQRYEREFLTSISHESRLAWLVENNVGSNVGFYHFLVKCLCIHLFGEERHICKSPNNSAEAAPVHCKHTQQSISEVRGYSAFIEQVMWRLRTKKTRIVSVRWQSTCSAPGDTPADKEEEREAEVTEEPATTATTTPKCEPTANWKISSILVSSNKHPKVEANLHFWFNTVQKFASRTWAFCQQNACVTCTSIFVDSLFSAQWRTVQRNKTLHVQQNSYSIVG